MQQIRGELFASKHMSSASTHTTSVCNLIHEATTHSLMCIPIHELHYKFSKPLCAHPFTRLSHVPFIHTMSLIRSRKQRTAFHLLPVHDPQLSKVWQLFIFHYTFYSSKINSVTLLHSRLYTQDVANDTCSSVQSIP